ncbi:MAG TPA: cation diffusion facilitator family transporter [Chitinophagaceae bacterium]|nr:cation diffusion facilitator family transporter [Chitinophagaceae bacterium]
MSGDHNHTHSHSISAADSGSRIFIIGICLNILFVFVEIVAGLLYGSIALLTDAGHNAGDVASLVLSLIALNLAKKKPTKAFTYGYKKTTVLAAFSNAVILLVAIGILGYESVNRLKNPEIVKGNSIAWVAGIGIVINGISAWLFFRNKKELNAKSAYLHLLSDAIVSAGVVAAGIIIFYTNWYWLDPAIGLIIMIVILVNTWNLLRDSFKMAVDAVPAGIDISEIKQVILKVPHVKGAEHIHVWPLSTTENALTAHVLIDDQLTFEQKINVVQEIRHELMHNNIHHSTIEMDRITGRDICEDVN